MTAPSSVKVAGAADRQGNDLVTAVAPLAHLQCAHKQADDTKEKTKSKTGGLTGPAPSGMTSKKLNGR